MSSAHLSLNRTAEPLSGMLVSIGFWLTLLAAAGIFAAVSLSPKLAVYLSLQDQQLAQQRELVKLEQQHSELERVIAALKEDSHFAAELARLEFDAVRPGEEILSVDQSLALDPNSVARKSAPPEIQPSQWQPWVAVLAYTQPLRTALLLLAAGLVLFAFGWLQDRTGGEIAPTA